MQAFDTVRMSRVQIFPLEQEWIDNNQANETTENSHIDDDTNQVEGSTAAVAGASLAVAG